MRRHAHTEGSTVVVLAVYLVTRKPAAPLVTRDHQRIETETILCKQVCLKCGRVFLSRLPFVA